MENDVASTPQKSSKIVPIAITVAIVVIILVGVVAFSMNKGDDQMADTMQPEPTQTMEAQPTQEVMSAESYKDGEYKATGMYVSPGGEESIDVTLTLKDGVVEDAQVISNAFRPISKQMQASFIEGYKEQVIGKKIDEIQLTKVSKSSLAPKGFNDAVEKIKAQAKA